MSRVIRFATKFPSYHFRKGEDTNFVEKIQLSLGILTPSSDIQLSPKHHTIRKGKRWKVGDKFSPKIWSGTPYRSSQIAFASDIEVKKVWDFKITTTDDDGEHDCSFVEFLGKKYTAYGYGGYDKPLMVEIAKNDGLSIRDFYDWFITSRTKQQRLDNEPKIFDGQIICWNDSVNY